MSDSELDRVTVLNMAWFYRAELKHTIKTGSRPQIPIGLIKIFRELGHLRVEAVAKNRRYLLSDMVTEEVNKW